MNIEATLQSIDGSLKALLVVAQTFSFAAQVLSPPAPDTKRRTTKDAAPDAQGITAVAAVVEGDPAGTIYWVIEKHSTVYGQMPGEPGCSIQGAEQVSASTYLNKKAEFAKKSLVPAAPAAAPASVSQPAAIALTASSSAAEPSFKEVTDTLVRLSKDEGPGLGRPALITLLDKYLSHLETGRTVPKLAALNLNAEIMKYANDLMSPKVNDDVFA